MAMYTLKYLKNTDVRPLKGFTKVGYLTQPLVYWSYGQYLYLHEDRVGHIVEIFCFYIFWQYRDHNMNYLTSNL